jgi:SAM-dependent methyltransferase
LADYGDDLAFVHDSGYLDVAKEAAGFVIGLLEARGPEGATVVELGSGSGATAAALSAAGHRVIGFEPSEAMLALARRRAPHADLRAGSLYDAELPPCKAVIAIGEVVNYAFDSRASKHGLAGFFARARRALEPGGLLIFDSAGPGRAPGGSSSGVREGDGWAVLFRATEDSDGRRLTRSITTFRREGGEGASWRRSDETHELLLYRARELAEMLRRAGFRVRVRRGYTDQPLGPGLRVLVAAVPERAR